MMKGPTKYVDGEHYFDTLADDVVFEFLYEFPGWPRETRGRENLIALYSGYGPATPLRVSGAIKNSLSSSLSFTFGRAQP
jgi:hypothetical protein